MQPGHQNTPTHELNLLMRECRLIGTYLVNQYPGDHLCIRYVAAHNALLKKGGISTEDLSLVAFVHRHPWSLPYLDAILALVRPNSLLRNKILIMLALLETTPEFVDEFLPQASSRLTVLWNLCVCSFLALGALVLGFLIYPLANKLR